LVVYLNLMSRWAFGYDYISRLFNNSHTIGIKQLTVTFTTFAELEFKSSLFVEDLYSMVISVGDYYVVLGIDCNS
jgi:hypothetical protein